MNFMNSLNNSKFKLICLCVLYLRSITPKCICALKCTEPHVSVMLFFSTHCREETGHTA